MVVLKRSSFILTIYDILSLFSIFTKLHFRSVEARILIQSQTLSRDTVAIANTGKWFCCSNKLPKTMKRWNIHRKKKLILCSTMIRETTVIPKLQKWYLIFPCLTLINLRYGSSVSRAIQEKVLHPSFHFSVVTVVKREPFVYSRQRSANLYI